MLHRGNGFQLGIWAGDAACMVEREGLSRYDVGTRSRGQAWEMVPGYDESY